MPLLWLWLGSCGGVDSGLNWAMAGFGLRNRLMPPIRRLGGLSSWARMSFNPVFLR